MAVPGSCRARADAAAPARPTPSSPPDQPPTPRAAPARTWPARGWPAPPSRAAPRLHARAAAAHARLPGSCRRAAACALAHAPPASASRCPLLTAAPWPPPWPPCSTRRCCWHRLRWATRYGARHDAEAACGSAHGLLAHHRAVRRGWGWGCGCVVGRRRCRGCHGGSSRHGRRVETVIARGCGCGCRSGAVVAVARGRRG